MVLLAPLGLVLGMAMPLGLTRLRGLYPEGVPWAWGINGVTSVVASVLALTVAINWGFAVTTLVALACYLVRFSTRSAVAGRGRPRPRSVHRRRDSSLHAPRLAAMPPVVHHAVLGLAIACLGGAGLRLASLAAPSGPERAVAAVVIAASIAALEALALGLVRLGTNTAVLAGAAALTWLAARTFLPAPASRPGHELAAAWRAASPASRIAIGAIAGVGLAWAVWLLRYPALGIDTVAYHLTDVVAWVGDGSPGAVEPLFPTVPVGNYPLTNEVLLAWGTGIARSFVFVGLWAPAMMALLMLASWAGLRTLRVPVAAATLAVGALCLLPVLTHYQQNGANTDIPAFAWLVSSAFLSLASTRRPALLAPALLAAGLAVGTKTTTLPLALLVLVIALVAARAELPRRARPLALAGAAAIAFGGYWYLRNLVDHGSPFWPFVETPVGRSAAQGDRPGEGRERQLPRPAAFHPPTRRRRVARAVRRWLLALGRRLRRASARRRQARDGHGRRDRGLGADLDERALHRRLGSASTRSPPPRRSAT